VSGLGFLSAEPPGVCSRCDQVGELRPYGPDFSLVCHRCGQLDPVSAVRGFARYVMGEDLPADVELWPDHARRVLVWTRAKAAEELLHKPNTRTQGKMT